MSPRSARARTARNERLVICIPIIHSQADMGAMAHSVRRVSAKKLGRDAWERNVNVIDEMWQGLRDTVEGWELPWDKVRLYQDGLPQCEREVEIVTTLAQAGSRNHQLLLSLMSRGAVLMGTESPDLLVEEYQLALEGLAAEDSDAAAPGTPEREARSRALLARRDRYIAARINESLRPGEIGLLFIGMLHAPERCLARDIRVSHPIRRPERPRREPR
ncbi:MAG: hypothetical protein HYU51_04925 [Candidatus Rokubacteria bacterium]|nr:hypothetical protein [Candidatus Rokubacteria bacterium]